SLVDPDEIHVFSGEVEAAPLAGGNSERLLTGMARQADATGSLREIDLKPDSFSRSLPPGLSYLHFTFDEMEENRFPVTGTHTVADTLVATLKPEGGFLPPLVPGVFGKALRLTGNGDQVITNWPGISGISPRTVSYWLRVDPRSNLTAL